MKRTLHRITPKGGKRPRGAGEGGRGGGGPTWQKPFTLARNKMAAGHLSLFPDYITESHHRKNGIAGFSVEIRGK